MLDQTSVGGAELVLLNLLRRIDRALVAPRMICLRTAGALAENFREVGVGVEVLDRRGRRDLSTVPKLVRRLRAVPTDVVLVNHHNRAALTLGRLTARLAGVPANVVAVHAMDLTQVGGRVLPRHDVNTLFLSDALVLLAPSQARYLHDQEGVGRFWWRRTREVVVPNGIELGAMPGPAARAAARARLGLADSDLVLGIVARLSPEKAHEVLLRAFATIAASRPQLRLVMVGGGEREAALRAEVAALGLDERVRFAGFRSDVPELLAGFDISCLSSMHEAAPLTVLEAMAVGLPVVSTDCGALRDIVADGHEGFLVPVGDSAALAERLARLADDPQLRARMGAQARQRAEREYSIDRTVAGYQRLLIELTSR